MVNGKESQEMKPSYQINGLMEVVEIWKNLEADPLSRLFSLQWPPLNYRIAELRSQLAPAPKFERKVGHHQYWRTSFTT